MPIVSCRYVFKGIKSHVFPSIRGIFVGIFFLWNDPMIYVSIGILQPIGHFAISIIMRICPLRVKQTAFLAHMRKSKFQIPKRNCAFRAVVLELLSPIQLETLGLLMTWLAEYFARARFSCQRFEIIFDWRGISLDFHPLLDSDSVIGSDVIIPSFGPHFFSPFLIDLR